MKCDICNKEMEYQTYFNFRVIRCCSEECHNIAKALYATVDYEIKNGINPREMRHFVKCKQKQNS